MSNPNKTGMKIRLLFLITALCTCTISQAQKVTEPLTKFHHHEISISYGLLPISDWNNIAGEFIFPAASFGLIQKRDNHYYGAINLNYTYRFNPKFSLGITGGITGNKGTWSSFYDKDLSSKDNRLYLFFLPTVKYNWFTRKNFALYSSVGLGAYFLRNQLKDGTHHKTRFAYQVNALGIEYGKRFAFFCEFGVGYSGTILVGERFRF